MVASIEAILHAPSASEQLAATASDVAWDGEMRIESRYTDQLLQLDNDVKVNVRCTTIL